MRKLLSPSHAAWIAPGAAFARRAAFTAIEVTAVATIIAILALILIPIIRGRVEEAKVVAAQDDMQGLEKAQTIAFADTGHYFRLQDLDRPTPDLTDKTLTPTELDMEKRKVPPYFWDQVVLLNQVQNLLNTWKGPYTTFHNTVTVTELLTLVPKMIRGTAAGALGGPILVMLTDDQDWKGDIGGLGRAKYPIDPWGNPYIFFGSGRMADVNNVNTAISYDNRVNYSTAVIYSLGPDGLPGDVINETSVTPAHFFRETEVLGKTGTDDLVREF
ncbi:MAG: hypothetical protein M1457_07430 [bacterium]|nr:hypothetical protein [bacterium]